MSLSEHEQDAMEEYQDKHWVREKIEDFLTDCPDDYAQFLLPRFRWLMRVWNTNRDHPYPSLKEGFWFPDEA